jgi:ABC-type transporter Mla maintaining outer membrane lipid asymmetry ATPase subunit MlaF
VFGGLDDIRGLAPGDAALTIEVLGLERSFGSTVVLDGVDLALESGGVFGLLGPPPGCAGHRLS